MKDPEKAKAGYEKMKATNIKKYGSEEAWKAELKARASRGGKKQVPTKGFGYKKDNESAGNGLAGHGEAR